MRRVGQGLAGQRLWGLPLPLPGVAYAAAMEGRALELPVVGWREWLELPELCRTPIKAKVDTGARTSALHAFRLRIADLNGRPHATFELHPVQRSAAESVTVTVPIRSFRQVRSSNGRTERRPVIVTDVVLGATRWPVEMTLTARDSMGFRMLLGRGAVKNRFVVDPGRSFVRSRGIHRRAKGLVR